MIQIRLGRSGRIIVAFPYNPDHIAKIKTIKGHRWHPGEKHWSFPYSSRILAEILSAFTGEEMAIDPSLQTLITQNHKGIIRNDTTTAKGFPPTELTKSKEEKPKLERNFEDLRKELVVRKYSPRTIKAYINYNKDFIKSTKKDPKDITEADIRDYLFYLVDEKE